MALPKEVRSIIARPLELGYRVEKRSNGHGVTHILIAPDDHEVANIPGTARYPDRLRKFKFTVDSELARFDRLGLAATTATEATTEPTEPTPVEEQQPVEVWITTTQAAEALGVTRGRVEQLRLKHNLTTERHKLPDARGTLRENMVYLQSEVEALRVLRDTGGTRTVSPEKRKGATATASATGRPSASSVTVRHVEPETERGKFVLKVKAYFTEVRQVKERAAALEAAGEAILEEFDRLTKERDEYKKKYDRVSHIIGRAVDEL